MNEATQVVYAPWWARTAAMLVDFAILLAVCYVDVIAINNPQTQNIVYQSIYVLYYVLFESLRTQATPGKMLLKIHVTMDDGSRVSLSRTVARFLLWTLFGLPFIFLSVSPSYGRFVENMNHLQAAGGKAAVSRWLQTGTGHFTEVEVMIFLTVYIVTGILFYWLPMIFTRQKTGLHDALTKTRVYKRAV